jgi:hypothetical protein
MARAITIATIEFRVPAYGAGRHNTIQDESFCPFRIMVRNEHRALAQVLSLEEEDVILPGDED